MTKTQFLQKTGVWKCVISACMAALMLLTGHGIKARTHAFLQIALESTQPVATCFPGHDDASHWEMCDFRTAWVLAIFQHILYTILKGNKHWYNRMPFFYFSFMNMERNFPQPIACSNGTTTSPSQSNSPFQGWRCANDSIDTNAKKCSHLHDGARKE